MAIIVHSSYQGGLDIYGGTPKKAQKSFSPHSRAIETIGTVQTHFRFQRIATQSETGQAIYHQLPGVLRSVPRQTRSRTSGRAQNRVGRHFQISHWCGFIDRGSA